MRGWYRLPASPDPARALAELGCAEGFYRDAEELWGDFVFEAAAEGVLAGVKTELGENLLTFAKLRGLLRPKRDRAREAREA